MTDNDVRLSIETTDNPVVAILTVVHTHDYGLDNILISILKDSVEEFDKRMNEGGEDYIASLTNVDYDPDKGEYIHYEVMDLRSIPTI